MWLQEVHVVKMPVGVGRVCTARRGAARRVVSCCRNEKWKQTVLSFYVYAPPPPIYGTNQTGQRPDKTRQDKTRQGKTRQDKTQIFPFPPFLARDQNISMATENRTALNERLKRAVRAPGTATTRVAAIQEVLTAAAAGTQPLVEGRRWRKAGEVTHSPRTALHVAVTHTGPGAVLVVNVLLAAGLSPNARGVSGTTALHDAVRYGVPEVVAALCAWPGVDANAADDIGRTPATLLASRRLPDVVKVVSVLAAAGADLNWVASHVCGLPLTPLLYSLMVDNLPAAEALFNAGADVPTADMVAAPSLMHALAPNCLAWLQRVVFAWPTSARCGWIVACLQGGLASANGHDVALS